MPDRLPPDHDDHTAQAARAIVETSPFAAMAFDAECRLTMWSPGAERMFGWTAAEVIGRPFPPEAIPTDEIDSSEERIGRAIEGASISGERVRRLARDGRVLILEIHGTALQDADGRTVGYGGQMIDITAMRDMAADLALVANVGSLLAGAAHSLGPDATLEQAAQTICDRLTSLPLVDVTAIGAFDDDGGATVIASKAPRRFPLRAGVPLPHHRAASMFEKARQGPWAERWESSRRTVTGVGKWTPPVSRRSRSDRWSTSITSMVAL